MIAEYWDPFNAKWQIADSTFGLVYFNTNSQLGQSAEDINGCCSRTICPAINTLWVTTNGSAYMTNYYLDPITMYDNVVPFGDEVGDRTTFRIPRCPTSTT